MQVAEAFKQAGINISKVKDALQALRGKKGGGQGGKKVDNPMGDQTFDALKTYGRDLVEEAQAGRLDPVIGRDEEIRRVIRILSRRTKVGVVSVWFGSKRSE
jgi:ATP-dependent Clp protease ATP-binding subunit ClpB